MLGKIYFTAYPLYGQLSLRALSGSVEIISSKRQALCWPTTNTEICLANPEVGYLASFYVKLCCSFTLLFDT